MKCQIIIDDSAEERCVIYAREMTDRIDEIRAFVESETQDLVGYSGNSIFPIDIKSVSAFICEGGSVYAVVDGERLALKERLYMIEKRLGKDYIRVSQSCIANLRLVKKFEATFSGALAVVFCDGYRDFVSRRHLKLVKERVGI